jgi:RNA polymerase sigma factor (sigma-70 family)
MTQQEAEYITAIRLGDKDGLRNIYRSFLPGIIGLITRNGGTKDDAMDIFQDALVIIFEKCRTENFALTSTFNTLLHGVCRNLWGNRLQKKSRSETSIPEEYALASGEDFREEMQQEEKRSIFWKAFKKLGEDCQRLMLMFFEKRTMGEIAVAMDFASEGYAKKRKFQCKEHLIRIVKEDARYADYAQN